MPKRTYYPGRPLFQLPTSEIADLYKEQKEMEAPKNFGLIGKKAMPHSKSVQRKYA
jgi:hypothetical protein